MDIKIEAGFTAGVWDREAGGWADMTGCTDLMASVLRPDETVVERPAHTTEDPKRVEVRWNEYDLSIPGTYVGDVSGKRPDGSKFCLRAAFKLAVGGELG